MSSYRHILYRDYSESFGSQKPHDPGVQHALYDATYHDLPANAVTAILDIGCGKGEWLHWLAARGFTKLTGVDGSPSDLAIARQQNDGITWVESNALEYLAASEPAQFDLIHAKDLVEHLTKDEFLQFLQSAHRALRPGGQIWMLTFNAQSPLSAATRYGDFTHETGHTPASLAQCLRACGFQGIRVQGRHYCSSSLSGRLRGVLSFFFYKAARLVLQLRHGSGGASEGMDVHTTLPDLFAVASRPLKQP